jgi:hypothetical protein
MFKNTYVFIHTFTNLGPHEGFTGESHDNQLQERRFTIQDFISGKAGI